MTLLYKLFILFINFYISNSFTSMIIDLPNPPSAIKHINYYYATNALHKWSIIDNKKSINNILWLEKSKGVYPKAAMIGIYSCDEILNYICYLEVLEKINNKQIFKIQNVFSNPLYNMRDDYNLIIGLKEYSKLNDILIDDYELKNIYNSRYFLTILYYSLISCS